jgi:hypothetical protein
MKKSMEAAKNVPNQWHAKNIEFNFWNMTQHASHLDIRRLNADHSHKAAKELTLKTNEKSGPLKASMSVVLKANEVVVAEVDDAILWNAVFAAINNGSSTLLPVVPTGAQALSLDAANPPAIQIQQQIQETPVAEPLNKLAKELGVELDVLIGSCDPTSSEPHLRLDFHCWEQMKKELPMRGPKAIAPIVLAATALCLWARSGGVGPITQGQAQAVLATLGLRDPNASRGIKSAEWLQSRPGGQIVLNPSQVSKAILIASCFCKQDWSAWKAL